METVYHNLAKYFKLDKEKIVITGGADLAIKNCFELFIKPKDKVITLTPSFAMIDIYSKLSSYNKLNLIITIILN